VSCLVAKAMQVIASSLATSASRSAWLVKVRKKKGTKVSCLVAKARHVIVGDVGVEVSLVR
jgi:hypothetical protein